MWVANSKMDANLSGEGAFTSSQRPMSNYFKEWPPRGQRYSKREKKKRQGQERTETIKEIKRPTQT